jgi:hypothetical protein
MRNSFVVPHGDARYPEGSWGLKLGVSVKRIRSGVIYAHHRTELEALGFEFSNLKVEAKFDLIYNALEAYKAVHGDLLVNSRFVVPHGDVNYPVETWGMNLGRRVNNIRIRSDYSQHRNKLEALGFVFRDSSQPIVEEN